MKIQNAQLALQVLKLHFAKSFGEEISELVFGTNMRELENSSFQFFSNEVTVNFNMFCALMED